MAKFDVYRMAHRDGYLLDCQADLLSEFATRFVAPLLPIAEAPSPVRRLNPIFEIEGRRYVMVPQLATSVQLSELQTRITSLAEHDLIVGNALDILISGL
jgi:toxin CcdB